MNQQALKTVIEFDKLPETDDIKEIKRRYLSDEISAFEFFQEASKYVNNADIGDDNE